MTVVTLRPSTGSSIRPAARPAARPVRLTRRGRRVVGGLAAGAAALAAFVLSLALGGGALASSHAPGGSPYQGMRQVVVQPGQNLWALATRAEPGADPRLVIPQIVSANALAGDAIYPGEQLWVPR
jgi:ferric-dicitrate binding protein FerR (iron transport regulator)